MRFGNKSAVQKSKSEYGQEIRTIMLVTCYSEGEDALRKTFDSLAETKYNEDFKLLFIVADGIITGSGNPKSTPQLIIDMLEMDSSWPSPPPALSYFSLADGSKEHNKARVYAAWYNFKVRIIIFIT
jgi:chitin synthase